MCRLQEFLTGSASNVGAWNLQHSAEALHLAIQRGAADLDQSQLSADLHSAFEITLLSIDIFLAGVWHTESIDSPANPSLHRRTREVLKGTEQVACVATIDGLGLPTSPAYDSQGN